MYIIVAKIIFWITFILSNILYMFTRTYSKVLIKHVFNNDNKWVRFVLHNRLNKDIDGIQYSFLVFCHLLLSLVFSILISLLWFIVIPFSFIAFAFNLVIELPRTKDSWDSETDSEF